ncbi:diaminopimelate decarboxylase [Entomomonas moraniae]|uniref:Diaminopimelate decarboxylase n=1 Tax=Entomomonas moraniae TaxID=2213226 RepID=A0A3Q9JJW7_9GAMM|nr:diaminopimelate decarboxylase [Entomomonas moraniae]AZS51346.1 diaminopimelate decarboxylase [Entomomonas moraniae]
MSAFTYQANQLYAENVPVIAIADQFGTPTYIYSKKHIVEQFKSYQDSLQGTTNLICYAVKANSNIAILNILAELGAGFDIVSRGELERVLAAGGKANKVVFSGVGKSFDDITRALEVGVYCFNVESVNELDRIQSIAEKMGKKAPISLRINPDVDAKTHPYISTGLKENKFGIDIAQAERIYEYAATLQNLDIKGIDCHIGSQLTTLDPFLDALDRLLVLTDKLTQKGITIEHLDLGGGLGVCYNDEKPPVAQEYIQAVRERLVGRDLSLLFEPGRYIVANAGILVTRVEYLKDTVHKNFAIVDAAMNDLIRPALYEAWMNIQPVIQKQEQPKQYDIVGPICETGDFLGKDRSLIINKGDLLAIFSAGAYGFAMSSNYNSRARAAEVIVDGNKVHLIRDRETLASLYANEHLLPH